MKKYNPEFIGTIVSSPDGKSSWAGTTITFWGKFKEKQPYHYTQFERENLIEALEWTKEGPSKEHHLCTAFQKIPEKYLYLEN
jgi:hypothetical protein